MEISKIHIALLNWYKVNKRDLPWRKSKDPYRIWISEIMLQQTRVETVIPYFNRFISNFPTVADLANAKLDTLLNLWAGLGYYSRAKNLKAAAEQIIDIHKGKFPRKITELLELKGIGPYTSAAIASIAFNQPNPAIDGNLERVISRLLALKENPKTSGKNKIYSFGKNLVAHGRAGDINQAIMDLSSKICLPKLPKCERCPVAQHCQAYKKGVQHKIPFRKLKKPAIQLEAKGIILISKRGLLLARRPKGAWLSGMWDIPWWVVEEKNRNYSLTKLGNSFASCAHTRTITKHKINFEVIAIKNSKVINSKILKKLPASAQEFKWISLNELHGLNLPRPSEKALEQTLPELE